MFNKYFKFWLVFITSIVTYYIYSLTDSYYKYFEVPVSETYAKICSNILNLFGFKVDYNQLNIQNEKFEMSIATGCDAIMPLVFLTSIITFYPYGDVKHKLKGILYGSLFIILSNIVRLCSLFILGQYNKDLFDFFHIQFWQAYFILFTMFYFINWLKKINN